MDKYFYLSVINGGLLMASIGTQFKTPEIILNESLIAFEDHFELNENANTSYENMFAQGGYAGLPMGSEIFVRTSGFSTPQSGRIHTVKQYEEDVEAIPVDTTKMRGDSFAVGSVEFKLDTNRLTNEMHYRTSQSIATVVNIECYNTLELGVPEYIDLAGTDFNYSAFAKIQTFIANHSIPSDMGRLYLSAENFGNVQSNIQTGDIYDEKIVRASTEYKVPAYANIPITPSRVLGGLNHIAGTAGGKTVTFDSLVSTDGRKSAVINLAGATDGDTLVPGDRLQFEATKKLNPATRLSTGTPLQLVVQNSVTAASSAFTNVEVKGGILDIATSPYFGNVTTVPAQGENVVVRNSYHADYYVTTPGFTFATVPLNNNSTLDIPGWGGKSGNSKPKLSLQSRNPNQPNMPFNIRTQYDSDVLQDETFMRIDMQPVYHAFWGYNIAILTDYTP